eukprot:15443828-Alexandrium_andersonii.AAC.1
MARARLQRAGGPVYDHLAGPRVHSGKSKRVLLLPSRSGSPLRGARRRLRLRGIWPGPGLGRESDGRELPQS